MTSYFSDRNLNRVGISRYSEHHIATVNLRPSGNNAYLADEWNDWGFLLWFRGISEFSCYHQLPTDKVQHYIIQISTLFIYPISPSFSLSFSSKTEKDRYICKYCNNWSFFISNTQNLQKIFLLITETVSDLNINLKFPENKF